MTLHDRYVSALIAKGNVLIVDARSTKYTVLERAVKPGTFFYVGSNGALRIGRTVTTSRPVSDEFKKNLLDGARMVWNG